MDPTAVAKSRSRSGNQTTLSRDTVPMQRGPAAALRIWPPWTQPTHHQAPRPARATRQGAQRRADPRKTSQAPARTDRSRPRASAPSRSCAGAAATPTTGPQFRSRAIVASLGTAAPM